MINAGLGSLPCSVTVTKSPRLTSSHPGQRQTPANQASPAHVDHCAAGATDDDIPQQNLADEYLAPISVLDAALHPAAWHDAVVRDLKRSMS